MGIGGVSFVGIRARCLGIESWSADPRLPCAWQLRVRVCVSVPWPCIHGSVRRVGVLRCCGDVRDETRTWVSCCLQRRLAPPRPAPPRPRMRCYGAWAHSTRGSQGAFKARGSTSKGHQGHTRPDGGGGDAVRAVRSVIVCFLLRFFFFSLGAFLACRPSPVAGSVVGSVVGSVRSLRALLQAESPNKVESWSPGTRASTNPGRTRRCLRPLCLLRPPTPPLHPYCERTPTSVPCLPQPILIPRPISHSPLVIPRPPPLSLLRVAASLPRTVPACNGDSARLRRALQTPKLTRPGRHPAALPLAHHHLASNNPTLAVQLCFCPRSIPPKPSPNPKKQCVARCTNGLRPHQPAFVADHRALLRHLASAPLVHGSAANSKSV
ncbi:hypothetical protein EDB80DRAFT_697936 [Ilyonectria destructans]|nr:hypothetical protein EDB80DRAFT_697936 [Ilyonectria destructans]